MTDQPGPDPNPPPPPYQAPPPGYYQQPPPAPQKRRFGCLSMIGLAVVIFIGLIVVVGIIAAVSGSSDDDKKSGSSAAAGPAHAVGETAHTGDFDVTVNGVEDPFVPTNQFERPASGNRYIAVDVTMKNTSSEQKTVSTLINFELADASARTFHIAIAGTDQPQVDGAVAGNDARRGIVVFEVPEDLHGLKLRVRGELTSGGTTFNVG